MYTDIKKEHSYLDRLVLVHDIINIFAHEAYSSNNPKENELGDMMHKASDEINDEINELILFGEDSDFIRSNNTELSKETHALILDIFTRMKFNKGFDKLGLAAMSNREIIWYTVSRALAVRRDSLFSFYPCFI